MQLRAASLDLNLAFDRVTPELLFDAMVDSATRSALAMALLFGRVGGRNMTSFQWITVYDVDFDRSIKQGGKKCLTLFDMVMRHWLRPLSAARKERRQGHRTRTCTRDKDDDILILHVTFADICYILALIKKHAAGNGATCDGENQTMRPGMEGGRNAKCVLEQCSGRTDLEFTMHDVNCKIPTVQRAGDAIAAINEADTMSARHRMIKVMSAMWAEMYSNEKPWHS